MKLIYKILKFICGTELHNTRINRSVFWSMGYTIFTVIIIVLGFFQFKDLNKTSSAEFAHKIKNDFFTEYNINLLTLFDEDVLLVDTDQDVAWFYIDTTKYKQYRCNADLHSVQQIYQANEIDALLQNFEDLGIYEKHGLIDMDFIYEGFDYYVESLWNNSTIQKYIRWLRSEPMCKDEYAYFEYIEEKLDKHPLNRINQ